jgi:hypothetical protein
MPRKLTETILMTLNSFENSIAFSPPELQQMHINNLHDNLTLIMEAYDRGAYDTETME